MTKKLLIILIIVVVAGGAILGGIFVWRRWPLKQEEKPPEEEKSEVEIPADWKTYRNEEWGIAFYYPPEWGEVVDYMESTGLKEYESYEDYPEDVKKYLEENPDIKKRLEEHPEEFRISRIEDFPEELKQALKEMEEEGVYLVFSNFGLDEFRQHGWGPQIRLTSVDKIRSRMSKYLTLLEKTDTDRVHPYSLFPLLGISIPGMVLAQAPEIIDEFPKIIEEINRLPQEASPKLLREKTEIIFLLFANGLRYMAEAHEESGEPGEIIGVEKAKRKQITNNDGSLKGVIEIGSEGWDVGARDYWDCILTTPEENNFIIYISFTLELPTYGPWEHPIEWGEGKRPPETEELMEQQVAQFENFVKNIKLLEEN